MKRNIKKIFILYSLLFLLLILYIFKLSIIDNEDINTNSYNPRLGNTDNNIKRGTIYDSDGEILAESIKTNNEYKRNYTYSEEFAHIIGFIPNGTLGVEGRYSFDLEKLDNEIYQRVLNITSENNELKGNSITLTINSKLQKYIYNKLGKSKGAIVVIEPKTGKILAMVSYPTFNPSKILENWDKLIKDENSPLINRVSQGLYPPGSTFKIITTAAEIESNPNWKDIEYVCKGSADFDDKKIRCFNSTVHGKINLKEALQYSCNTFFSSIGKNLKWEILHIYAEKAMFNKSLNYPLEYKQSSFVLSANSTTDELVQTAIGQGKTLVTPIHMTLIACATANNGIMMQPYILDKIESYNGTVLNKSEPKEIARIFEEDTASILKEMMKSVVTSGTAIEAKTKEIEIAGKTGTAENGTGKDHSWFVAFAPADNPNIAVGIILENIKGKSKAISITRDIILYYIKECQ